MNKYIGTTAILIAMMLMTAIITQASEEEGAKLDQANAETVEAAPGTAKNMSESDCRWQCETDKDGNQVCEGNAYCSLFSGQSFPDPGQAVGPTCCVCVEDKSGVIICRGRCCTAVVESP